MKKVIMDVDTGIDDALALMVAFKSEMLNVLGVTTVVGNIPVYMATENTLRVLKLLGHEEVEVYEGCTRPLEREGGFKEAVHGERGLAGQLKDMDTKEKNRMHAVDFIIDEVNKAPGEISLIMLGPSTNLAAALRKDPSISEKISEVYIMGGAFEVPGNITPVAEFNFYADPDAAYEIIKSTLNTKIIGLDITTKARFYEDELDILDRETDLGNFLYNILSCYMNHTFKDINRKSCSLHDPLVTASSIDESLIQFRDDFVDIEKDSRLCDGQSISYFNRSGYVPNTKVAISHDDKRFKKMLLDIMVNSQIPIERS